MIIPYHQSQAPVAAEEFATHELFLGNDLDYLKALIFRHSGIIEFKTGASRILTGLLEHLPSCAGYEAEKMELCNRLCEIVYPLAANLSAQAVSIVIRISEKLLTPPAFISALGTYVAIEEKTGTLRYCFVSPHHESCDVTGLSVMSGMTVYCEPLFYHYHQLTDDRVMSPRHATSNLPHRHWADRYRDSTTDADGNAISEEQQIKENKYPRARVNVESHISTQSSPTPYHLMMQWWLKPPGYEP